MLIIPKTKNLLGLRDYKDGKIKDEKIENNAIQQSSNPKNPNTDNNPKIN